MLPLAPRAFGIAVYDSQIIVGPYRRIRHSPNSQFRLPLVRLCHLPTYSLIFRHLHRQVNRTRLRLPPLANLRHLLVPYTLQFRSFNLVEILASYSRFWTTTVSICLSPATPCRFCLSRPNEPPRRRRRFRHIYACSLRTRRPLDNSVWSTFGRDIRIFAPPLRRLSSSLHPIADSAFPTSTRRRTEAATSGTPTSDPYAPGTLEFT